MMKLILHPVRSDAPLRLERDGDALLVNGIRFDFAPLGEGEDLPPEAIDSPVFCGPARRENGTLELNLLLPHAAGADDTCRTPAPIVVDVDGPIQLPGQEA